LSLISCCKKLYVPLEWHDCFATNNFLPTQCSNYVFATLSNLTDPVFIREASIQHDGVVTNPQKGLIGYMPGAHFLTIWKMYRISFCTRLQQVIMKSSTKGNTVLGCIDVDIRAGGSCHRQFVNGISSLWLIFPRNMRHFWVPMVAQETV
jgi:hypothetical protein